MVVDVQLCKEEGKPFGFRLIGGADFEIPLTCSKVSERGRELLISRLIMPHTSPQIMRGKNGGKIIAIKYAARKMHFRVKIHSRLHNHEKLIQFSFIFHLFLNHMSEPSVSAAVWFNLFIFIYHEMREI